MSQDFARAFYSSKAWRDCRTSFIAKRRMIDGGMCQRCHEQLGYIIHHKIELTPQNIDDDTITLNHANLIYVCHECHNEIHDVYQGKARTYFDEDGNVHEIPPSKSKTVTSK